MYALRERKNLRILKNYTTKNMTTSWSLTQWVLPGLKSLFSCFLLLFTYLVRLGQSAFMYGQIHKYTYLRTYIPTCLRFDPVYIYQLVGVLGHAPW